MSVKRNLILLVVWSVIFLIAEAGLCLAQEDSSENTSLKEISLTADIAPFRKVQVVPEVNGTLDEILVDMGSKVEKGQVIARIDSREIALQVEQAEAGLISARANYEKTNALARIQTENNFEKAKAAFQSAEVQLQLAKVTAKQEFLTQLKQAQAGYQQALANFNNAKEELQRAQDDYSRGAIPEQALDKAKLSFEVAKAQLASAKASLDNLERMKEAKSWEAQIQGAQAQWENAKAALEVAKVSLEQKLWEQDINLAQSQLQQAKSSLELAKSRLGDCTIKAPISGVIEGKFVDEGSVVGPGQPLVSIVDISSVKIVLHVGEEVLGDLPRIRKIVVEIGNYLNQTFTPQEINISPTMEPRSRKIKVEVRIPNPDLRIKPGMFARVKLLVEPKK